MLPVKIINILLGRESQHRKMPQPKQKSAVFSSHKNDFAQSAPVAKKKKKKPTVAETKQTKQILFSWTKMINW